MSTSIVLVWYVVALGVTQWNWATTPHFYWMKYSRIMTKGLGQDLEVLWLVMLLWKGAIKFAIKVSRDIEREFQTQSQHNRSLSGMLQTSFSKWWTPLTMLTCVTRQETLRSLSLSYPTKDWWAGAPPILLLAWHQLFKNMIYDVSRVKFCAHPSFGMTRTKTLRSIFSWHESVMFV